MKADDPGNIVQDESLEFIDPASITTQILQDVPLANRFECGQAKRRTCLEDRHALVLKVCADNQLYLVNNCADVPAGTTPKSDGTTNAITICHGTILVGYGKGRWVDKSTDEAKDIRYQMQSSTDKIIYNTKQTTLGALVGQKRLTDEADIARVCYHDLVDDPKEGDKCAFYLKVKMRSTFNS